MESILSYGSSCTSSDSDDDKNEQDIDRNDTICRQHVFLKQQQHLQPQQQESAVQQEEQLIHRVGGGGDDDGGGKGNNTRSSNKKRNRNWITSSITTLSSTTTATTNTRWNSRQDDHSHKTNTTRFVRNRPHVRGDWPGHVFISIGFHDKNRNHTTSREKDPVIDSYSRTSTIPITTRHHDPSNDDDDDILLLQEERYNIFRSHILFPSIQQWNRCMMVGNDCCSDEPNIVKDSSWMNSLLSHNNTNANTNTTTKGWHISLSHPIYIPTASTTSMIQSLQQKLSHFSAFSIQLPLPDNDDREEDADDSTTDTGDNSNTAAHRKNDTISLLTTKQNTSSISHDDHQSKPQEEETNYLWRILVNDNRTRSFLAWPVLDSSTSGSVHLVGLVKQINSILQYYQQPTYYYNVDDDEQDGKDPNQVGEKPFFHVSLASIPGDYYATSTQLQGKQSNKGSNSSMMTNYRSVLSIPVDHIECTLGGSGSSGQHYRIPLMKSIGSSG